MKGSQNSDSKDKKKHSDSYHCSLADSANAEWKQPRPCQVVDFMICLQDEMNDLCYKWPSCNTANSYQHLEAVYTAHKMLNYGANVDSCKIEKLLKEIYLSVLNHLCSICFLKNHILNIFRHHTRQPCSDVTLMQREKNGTHSCRRVLQSSLSALLWHHLTVKLTQA